MKLLLDIGNSSVNWAIQEQGEFTSFGAFSYKKNNFKQCLQENLFLLEKPSDILLSNVAGIEIFSLLNEELKKQWQQECWQPHVSDRFKELKNSYRDIQQMGLDRWLTMIACWEEYQSALCLIGCGTALTIDLINSEGQHLGGYIVPGIELMQKTLVNNTAQINVIVKNQVSLDYATDTQAAVNNGAFLAAVSLIEHVVDKFSNESKSRPICIISGGMAEKIKPLLSYSFQYKPNLVLRGLSILHKASR